MTTMAIRTFETVIRRRDSMGSSQMDSRQATPGDPPTRDDRPLFVGWLGSGANASGRRRAGE